MATLKLSIRVRVREGYSSADAKRYARILGARPVGNAWTVLDLSAADVRTLRAAGIFELSIGDEPAPSRSAPRLVALNGRRVNLEGRHRVIVRGVSSCARVHSIE